jgi:hypothetical protein
VRESAETIALIDPGDDQTLTTLERTGIRRSLPHWL